MIIPGRACITSRQMVTTLLGRGRDPCGVTVQKTNDDHGWGPAGLAPDWDVGLGTEYSIGLGRD